MPSFRFLNEIVKPWDELNALLSRRLALQPNLSDVTRLAGSLAVAIRHQVDVVGIKDTEANAECIEHRIVCDVSDFYKHGPLRDPRRNNSFSTEAHFLYKLGNEFSFLRNVLYAEHATFGKQDFLHSALVAINYWIHKRALSLNWNGEVLENPIEFHDEAFLYFESKKCITMNQVRLAFFLKGDDGSLRKVDPPEVRFAIY